MLKYSQAYVSGCKSFFSLFFLLSFTEAGLDLKDEIKQGIYYYYQVSKCEVNLWNTFFEIPANISFWENYQIA